MDYLKDFVIPFKGLKSGEHNFAFEITKKFFDHFEYGELDKGDIRVKMTLLKEDNMLSLLFDIDGYVEVLCDRCGEKFRQPLQTRQNIYIKFGDEEYEETDEVYVISQREYEIDVSQFIYEFINLSLPYRKIHPLDENGNEQCDQEVLQKLGDYKRESSTDPRWDALKKLKNKD